MTTSLSIPFSKYHGLGNHFVIVDNRKGLYDFTDSDLVQSMCCSRTGVGADCLLELINCRHSDHLSCAYEFVNHSVLGTLGKFCGNGSRCLAHFAHSLGIVYTDNTFFFCGPDGQHWGRHLAEKGLVEVSMRDVTDIRVYSPNSYYLFTGSPVHVEFVKNVEKIDLKKIGDAFRFDNERYPEGVNVMIVDDNEEQITMRSYERGADCETWSCGTGTTGVALVTDYRANEFRAPGKQFTQEIIVRLGKLHVKATRTGEKSYANISLIGPVRHVFDGTYFRER